MWDVDGNQYIDYGMGNAAHLLGHGSPDVVEAVHQALDRGFHFGEDHPLQVEWAQLIQVETRKQNGARTRVQKRATLG